MAMTRSAAKTAAAALTLVPAQTLATATGDCYLALVAMGQMEWSQYPGIKNFIDAVHTALGDHVIA